MQGSLESCSGRAPLSAIRGRINPKLLCHMRQFILCRDLLCGMLGAALSLHNSKALQQENHRMMPLEGHMGMSITPGPLG